MPPCMGVASPALSGQSPEGFSRFTWGRFRPNALRQRWHGRSQTAISLSRTTPSPGGASRKSFPGRAPPTGPIPAIPLRPPEYGIRSLLLQGEGNRQVQRRVHRTRYRQSNLAGYFINNISRFKQVAAGDDPLRRDVSQRSPRRRQASGAALRNHDLARPAPLGIRDAPGLCSMTVALVPWSWSEFGGVENCCYCRLSLHGAEAR